MKTFTLRCGTRTKETRIDDWGLSIYDDEMVMSCKIVRRDYQQWHEIQSGVIFFKDSKGRLHEGKYINGLWRARVPLCDAETGIRYWPHKLFEGNEQNMNSCEVNPRHLARPKPEPIVEEGPPIMPGFTVLETEIIEQPLEAKPDPIVETGFPPLDLGPLPNGPAISKVKEEPPEAKPEPKPTWTRGMERAAEEREAEKKALTCPICGTTTTKRGKPFKSVLSVHRHVTAAHKETKTS